MDNADDDAPQPPLWKVARGGGGGDGPIVNAADQNLGNDSEQAMQKSPACPEAMDTANHNFGTDSEQTLDKKKPACTEDMDTNAFAMKRSHEITPFPQVL